MHKIAPRVPKRARFPKQKGPNVKNVMPADGACYVLITCGEPSKDGKMQVEMTYEGDPILAAYLVESAQQFIDVE